MEVRNFYVPTEVTDFSDPLSKVVDRAKRQNQENLDNQLAHSQALKEADPGVQNLALLKKGIEFSTTIAKIVDKDKAKKKQEKDDKTKRKLFTLVKNPESREALDEVLKYRTTKEGIEKGQAGFHETVKKTLTGDEQLPLRDYLLAASASELGRVTELRSIAFVQGAHGAYNDMVNALSQEDREAYELKHKGNAESIQDDFINWSLDQLDEFSVGEVSANVIDELKRIADTKSALAVADYKVESLTKSNKGFQDDIDSWRIKEAKNQNVYAKGLQDRINSLIDPENGVTKADAANTTTAQLVMAGYGGRLTHAELASMRGGNIEGHPAGDTGKILLSDEQWDRISKSINAHNAKAVATHDAAVEQQFNSLKAQASKNQLTYKQLQSGLQDLKSLGMNESSEKYKALANMDLNAQSEDYYKIEKDEIENLFRSGRVNNFKDHIEGLRNNRLKDEFKERIRDLSFSKKENGWPEKSYKDEATNLLDTKIKKITLLTGQKLPYGSTTLARDFIAAEADRIYMAEYIVSEKGDTTVASRARQRLDARLKELGFEIKADEPGAGVLSHTLEGEFPYFDTFDAARGEGKKGDAYDLTNRIFRIHGNPTSELGNTHRERVVNSKGVLKLEELIAVSEMDRANGTFTAWPPDVLLAAETLGVQPSVLVKAQIDAYLRDGTNKEQRTAKVFKLENLKKNIPNSDVKVREFIEKTGDRDLLSYYEHLGIRGLDEKQLGRLMAFEKNIQQTDTKQKRLLRVRKLFGKNFKIPASALESDEALDRFITQQGLLEPK